ncbi:MAG: molybdopterin oxidoreductase [Desulfobacterales bacterium CG23_combo_of_CG06-09_8_20_14_all_51_8]|nr:MAG: molybdopterin oxidoreductase [Desulfobacterales bacterium CG23_combo_of_CG06-09_8_20_14_all_51_8]
MKEKHSNTPAKRYGMIIDLDKCTGCGACMVGCYAENNIPFKPDETNKLDSINWIRVFKLTNHKPYPETEICYLPMPCMQCDGVGKHGHSPCVSVCPAVATDYNYDTGIISQIYTRCFGCRYCMAACPYHARKFNWWDPVWPADMEKYLSPNVSPRMRGVVEKCSFCFHRYQLAREKAYMEKRTDLAEGEYQTACADACPTKAITFGDLNNKDHAVYKLKNSPNAFRLLERLETNPKVYYLTTKKWVRKAGDNYLAHEEPETLKTRIKEHH